MIRRRELKAVDVAAKISRRNPRVLTDVFAVRFTAHASHHG
jgi:hypothetical protein